LLLSTRALAQSVKIEDDAFRAEDNWLPLPPGAQRRIRLNPRAAGAGAPRGVVAALNGERIAYGATAG
jgi:beta-mannosidase